jgi:nanoRNase/pAp phosphatase (c-di-AMP/oligoRNAs hydrolase)
VSEDQRSQPPPAPDPLPGLYRAVAGATGLVICTHRNPDPDSISSALALRYLLEHAAGVRAIVAYEGVIGRAENRALVSLLRCTCAPGEPPAIDWNQVALVDTQPRSGNNSFPRAPPGRSWSSTTTRLKTTVALTDIRPGCRATAPILAEYLHLSG